VSNNIEFKVTGNTQFKKGEILYAYFEVLEPLLGRDASTNVQVQMRVVDVKSGEVKSDSQPISAMAYVKPGNPVILIGRGINIKDLPAGSYRLDVRAANSHGKSSAWRSVNFTVE
jgi:predicted phage tail protein